MVELEGIEPNCRHPAYYGKWFTVTRREQVPLFCNTLPYGFRHRSKVNEECVVKHTAMGTHLV